MSLPIKIFIIDDDALFVFLTKKMIGKLDPSAVITEFKDGLEGIDYLKKIDGSEELLPHFIFLDLNMPVMDGWEFLDEFKKTWPIWTKNPKLYIFSSSISPFDIERAKDLAVVSDFIVKPLTPDKFLSIVQNI